MQCIILFDLDGTLTDPGVGITNSVMYALKKFGIEETDRTKLYPFIGPPLLNSFMEFYGFDEKKAEECTILLATSKPELLAKQILEHFNLMQYFDFVTGSDLEGKRNTKGKVISYALKAYGEKSGLDWKVLKEKAVMAGDRFHDIEGAKENDIASVGVLFGYGSREELTAAGADRLIERPEEMHYAVEEIMTKGESYGILCNDRGNEKSTKK